MATQKISTNQRVQNEHSIIFHGKYSFKDQLWILQPKLMGFRTRSSVARFGKSLQVFGNFLTVYFVFVKMLNLLWQICDIIGLNFIVANGQTLKNNLIILSR